MGSEGPCRGTSLRVKSAALVSGLRLCGFPNAQEKDSGAWGPAQKGKAGGSGAEQGGNTVVRSSAAPPGAERRPLLPKKRLDINTDL